MKAQVPLRTGVVNSLSSIIPSKDKEKRKSFEKLAWVYLGPSDRKRLWIGILDSKTIDE
jgi:hypothetical protein